MELVTLFRSRRRILWILSVVIVLCSPAVAGVLSLKVVDASGAPAKDVLVIVQDLRVRDADEVFRALTDKDGCIPSRELPTGEYRIISTNPYGHFKTDIREVVIGASAMTITLTLDLLGTHGYGDRFVLPESHFTVLVRGKDGTPVEGATVLVRDSDATLATRHWYRTDTSGKANVMSSGTDIVMVVFFGEKVVSRVLTVEAVSKPAATTITLP